MLNCFLSKNAQSRAVWSCLSKSKENGAEKMLEIYKKLNTFYQISEKKAKKGLIPARI